MRTWNPVIGCAMVSPGCTNCYAMRMAARLQAMGAQSYKGVTRSSGGRFVWTGKLRVNESSLDAPLRWKRPKKISSTRCRTSFKWASPMPTSSAYTWAAWDGARTATCVSYFDQAPDRMRYFLFERSLPILSHVWLGMSVDAATTLAASGTSPRARQHSIRLLRAADRPGRARQPRWNSLGNRRRRSSGPKARLIHEAWVDELHDECRGQNVGIFFKQWGGTNKKASGRRYRGLYMG